MGVNLLKIEQEKNNQIIDLKTSMGQLREQLADQIDNVKKFEISLITKEKQLQSMTDKNDIQTRGKNDAEDENQRLNH